MALTFGSAGAFGYDLDSPVVVNVDHLQPRLAEQVGKHAAEGYKALARYMERTRLYHRLWFDDVTRPRAETIVIAHAGAEPREFRKHATEWR